MAATVSRGTNATRVLDRGDGSRRGRSSGRADVLFAEDRFDWPELPGDPKKEAKLPFFRFHDIDEARFFLRLFIFNNVLAVIGCINIFLLGNQAIVGLSVMAIGTVSNVLFIRLWIRLCKRAHPKPHKIHWWTSGLLSLPTWQALSQASSLVRKRR